MYKLLMGTSGIVLGSVAMGLLPYALVPHPRELVGFVYLAAWLYGIPFAAVLGLIGGLCAGARMDRKRR